MEAMDVNTDNRKDPVMDTDTTVNETLDLDNGLTRYALGDPLKVVETGEQEELRVYSVMLRVEGTDIEFGAEIPLRYNLAKAAEIGRKSDEAKVEAFKRAVRLERRANHTSPTTRFVMGDVELLRYGLRPARIKLKVNPVG